HLGDVWVGVGGEGERGRGVAVGVAGRLHVQQAVEAGELLLDDLRHRVFHRLGRGARVAGVDDDRGRGDRRVLGHRQLLDGQRARQHDDDGDDPREDGSVDEETGHGRLPHCAAAAGAAGAAPASSACTATPGRTFCRPSMMMRSPAFTPLVTTQFSPSDCATCTGRATTLLSASTAITSALPSGSRLSALCGTRIASLRVPCGKRARTYMPGSSMPSALENCARRVTLPVPSSTVTSDSARRPSAAYSLPSSRISLTGTSPLAPACRR